MEPQSRKRPKEIDDTIAKKVCHQMHDIRSFLHNADNRSAPPALVSRHNTQQPFLAVACGNDEVGYTILYILSIRMGIRDESHQIQEQNGVHFSLQAKADEPSNLE